MSPAPPPHLLSCLPADLHAALTADGVPTDIGACRRMLAGMWQGGAGPVAARPVRKEVQARVEAWRWDRPEVLERVRDPFDQSVRYLLRSSSGAGAAAGAGRGEVFEVVRIPLEKPGRFTLCLSSQAGCAMQCGFCATGRLGLSRSLRTEEICGAFLAVRDDTLSEHPEARVTGAVFMGQGEPLHNYDAVIQAAKLLSEPCCGRIDAKNISISTVGLVPQMRRYIEERHPWRLILSLTSTVLERRAALLPVASRWTLEEVAEVWRGYAAQAGRVTVAWVLIGGLNHDAAEVAGLARLFDGVPIRLNLIDVNVSAEVAPGGRGWFRRATEAERGAFMDALQPLRIPIVRRYSVGSTQNSACGMLAAREAGSAAGGYPQPS